MKILMVVSHFFPASVGGAERQCFRQAQALVRLGHEVTIVTKWLIPDSARSEIMDGVLIRRRGCFFPIRKVCRHRGKPVLPQTGGRRRAAYHRGTPSLSSHGQNLSVKARNLLFMAELAWGLITGRFGADVIHVHESTWIAGFAQKIGQQLGIPVLCKEATQPVLRNIALEKVPWNACWMRHRMNCRFIAMTDGIARELVAAGIPRGRIVKVPNGVELPVTIADPEKHAEALYVGNFTQGGGTKGVDILLQAWGKSVREEPEMRLRLYGRGDTRMWEDYAVKHGCGSSVFFEGETEDIQSVHRTSGFLVVPSRREGLSNALLEAMASGLPAVVSDIPGNMAAVRDGMDGQVVPVGDAEALAAAMVEMVRNPGKRVRMGHSARQRIEAEFSLGRVAQQLEEAYVRARSANPAKTIQ